MINDGLLPQSHGEWIDAMRKTETTFGSPGVNLRLPTVKRSL